MKKTIIGFLCLILGFSLFASNDRLDYNSLYLSMLACNTKISQAEQDIYNSQLIVKDAKSLYQPNIGYSLMATYMANPAVGQIIVGTDDVLSQIGLPANTVPSSYVTLYDGMDNSYYSGSISLTQPLLTCGKIPVAVKLAKTNSSAHEIKKSNLVSQMESELNIRLYSLYYINEIYALLDRAEEYSDTLVDISNKAYESGIMVKQDVLDAEIQAKQIKVKRNELDSQFKDVMQGLRVLVGRPELEFEDIDFTPDFEYLKKYENVDVDTLKSLATDSSRMTLQMVNKMQAAADLQEDLAWRGIYGAPDIFLNVSAGYGGPSFPFAEIGWRQKDDWSVNVSVVMSGTIWDGGRKAHSVDRAKSSKKSADIAYQSAVETIETTLTSSYNSMLLALAKHEYGLLKKENGLMQLDKLEQELVNGTKTRTDILKKELELIEYDVDILTQQITLATNVFTIDYLVGNTI